MEETKYGDWTRKDRTWSWINQKTKEESPFHPLAMEIGNIVYKASEKLTDSIKSEQTKNKYKRSK